MSTHDTAKISSLDGSSDPWVVNIRVNDDDDDVVKYKIDTDVTIEPYNLKLNESIRPQPTQRS